MLLVALIIKDDDPGSAFFKQKRAALHKKLFQLCKFRSMKTSTPDDVPTHMLDDPDQYLLKIGKGMREFRIDVLPQPFNILKGDMSIIGPRPVVRVGAISGEYLGSPNFAIKQLI